MLLSRDFQKIESSWMVVSLYAELIGPSFFRPPSFVSRNFDSGSRNQDSLTTSRFTSVQKSVYLKFTSISSAHIHSSSQHIMIEPTATISPLGRSDGSAVYTCPATGFQILGSVNGPIELPARRDAQKPEEATIEVLVKPATAQSAIGERYVENILKALLGKVILGREKGFARRGIVVTLLIQGSSSDGKIERGDSVSLLLPRYHGDWH